MAVLLQELLNLCALTRESGYFILYFLRQLLFCQQAAMDHLNDAEHVVLEVKLRLLLFAFAGGLGRTSPAFKGLLEDW